uniref:Uncharacterized protein n=1 Tax=Gopherus evgoodei TaxID=1825980 RepID=A0A8C4VPM2_9SAUR
MSLRPPNYSKPFHLFVHERGGIASGVLTQLSGPHHFPLAFYSQQIDPVAQGTPSCTRTLAAAALLITKAKSLTLGHLPRFGPLMPCQPFCICQRLLEKSTSLFWFAL